MCGICGTVGWADEAELGSMTRAMAHRGPDGSGIKTFDGDVPAGLGHRRLAIIDPTPAGAQPMAFADRWWITYNGELYNFRELRRELEARGERFVTECDTEVLLRMFVVHGPEMLQLVNGMFAFAIWDDREKRLFLARDRLGVKPLYYTRASGRFAFASELKALLPLIGTPSLDMSALADYLTFLWVPDPKTAFHGILKLPPGHYAWADSEHFSTHQYWDLEFVPEERSEAEWAERVADTVQRAVVRQMVSDVPLGSFLSGGVDSSSIAAAMKTESSTVDTYTIGFAAEDLKHEIVPDDVRYARRVAALLGTEYHESMLRPDVLDLLPKTIWHLEEPVADPAAISTYLVCREARQRMPVMLSGMGADELFAGSPWPRGTRPSSRPSRSSGPPPRPAPQSLEVHARQWTVGGRPLPLVLELLQPARARTLTGARRRCRGWAPRPVRRAPCVPRTGYARRRAQSPPVPGCKDVSAMSQPHV